jgi:hypothetical protein
VGPEQITWLDHSSTGNGNWIPVSELQEDIRSVEISTVGWVIAETDDCIIVVSTLTEHGLAQSNIQILKPCIVKRKKLR